MEILAHERLTQEEIEESRSSELYQTFIRRLKRSVLGEDSEPKRVKISKIVENREGNETQHCEPSSVDSSEQENSKDKVSYSSASSRSETPDCVQRDLNMGHASNCQSLYSQNPSYQSACYWLSNTFPVLSYTPSSSLYPAHKGMGKFKKNENETPRIGKGWYKGQKVCRFLNRNGWCGYEQNCCYYHANDEEWEEAKKVATFDFHIAICEVLFNKEVQGK